MGSRNRNQTFPAPAPGPKAASEYLKLYLLFLLLPAMLLLIVGQARFRDKTAWAFFPGTGRPLSFHTRVFDLRGCK